MGRRTRGLSSMATEELLSDLGEAAATSLDSSQCRGKEIERSVLTQGDGFCDATARPIGLSALGVAMSVLTRPALPVGTNVHLGRLYIVRFVFAAAWAGTFAGLGGSLGPASITLVILYPVFDLVAAAYDARITRNPMLYVNIAVSTAAAIALAITAAADIPAVLRVWGTWAALAGLIQLFVAIKRRSLGGQGALITSGSISVIAGGAFVAQAGNATSLTMCAGYAALGGVFFLISAMRQLRQDRPRRRDQAA